MYVDPSQTIAAPYSQGNELVSGQNAREQYATMSLCSMIYNNKQGFSSVNDLIQIMNIGNQSYSSLFQLASWPVLLNVDRITYNVIIKCGWYWLPTSMIEWKLHWYCWSRDCGRGIQVLCLQVPVFTGSLWITIISRLHQFSLYWLWDAQLILVFWFIEM